jgi:hypothetical protein
MQNFREYKMNNSALWTNDQVKQLIIAVSDSGKEWSKVATIVGRTPESCRDKYVNLSTSDVLNIFIEERDLQKTDDVINVNEKDNNNTEIIEKTENLNNNGEDKLSNLITVLNDSISDEKDANNNEIILNSNDESQSSLTNKRKRIDNEILNIKYKKNTKQIVYWSEMEIFKLLNQFESTDDILNEKLHAQDWKQISKLFNGRRSEQSCKFKIFALKNEKEKLEFYWNKYLGFVENNSHITNNNNNNNKNGNNKDNNNNYDNNNNINNNNNNKNDNNKQDNNNNKNDNDNNNINNNYNKSSNSVEMEIMENNHKTNNHTEIKNDNSFHAQNILKNNLKHELIVNNNKNNEEFETIKFFKEILNSNLSNDTKVFALKSISF